MANRRATEGAPHNWQNHGCRDVVELDCYPRRTKHRGDHKGKGENRTEQGEVPKVGASTGSATSDVLRLTEALS